MNKIYIVFFALVVLFTACEDKLDLTPYDGLTDEQLFSNAEGFETAIKGVYSGFRATGYYGESAGILTAPDILADNLILNMAGRQTQRALFEWRNTAVDEAYGIYYRGYRIASRANRILANIDKLPDGDFKNNIEAEAKALRAIVHFDIARTYCEIPTQKVNSNDALGIYYQETYEPDVMPRRSGTTVAGTYGKIVKDLTDAVSLISEDNGIGRLNEAAVNGILSRVYLHMGDYTNAEGAANAVIAAGVPVASYSEFGNIWLDTYEKSVLFKIRVTDQDNISPGVPYSQEADGEIRSEYCVSYPLFQLYKTGDVRLETTIQTSDFQGKTYNHVAKYLGRATGNKNVVDGKYIRMAEVYLNKAEALVEDGNSGNDAQALAALDEVRKHRYVMDPASWVSPGETGQALKDAIQLERRLELAFEGDRWYTLKRRGERIERSENGEFADGTGTKPVVLVMEPDNFRWLLPIPQGAIDSNPGLAEDQNPGY